MFRASVGQKRINHWASDSCCLGAKGSMVNRKDEDKDELDRIAKTSVSLEGKDYVALAIAALETIFLPLVILAIVVLVIVLVLR